DLYFVFPARLIVFDNFTRRITFLTLDSLNSSKAQKESDRLYKILRSSLRLNKDTSFEIQEMKHLITEEEFKDMVVKAKEYILKGDVIQVVISQRFEIKTDIDSISLYRALRVVNPSPYMFLLEFPEYSIIGSSPETMVKVEADNVEVRPIAGTRRRGKTKEEDEELARELLADEKELAEHTMLVDLGRNDVGRIAKIGSVTVSDLMNIEKYSHVMHLVSSVKGKVKDGIDAFDVFKATFPAGTVTGAPKIRAMEIIEELEMSKRGIYAGAVGYFSYNKDMDFCITIRTFLKKEDKVYIQAGAGIVADSVPENEYMETLYKAGGLIKSIMEIKEIIG
ncbi:MAG TPA: anthranilate synthase component I family protein, partial [Syntrophorhabdaceae bacterium]|nr:anthranilate synthase component I family protein [Syntrophorhabdaceae bacterium]